MLHETDPPLPPMEFITAVADRLGAYVAAAMYVKHTKLPCYVWCFPNVPVEHIQSNGQRFIIAPTYYVTRDFILGQASVVTRVSPDRFVNISVSMN